MSDRAKTSTLAERMDSDRLVPVLVEPQGGPIPGKPDVRAAAGDPEAQQLQQQWLDAKADLLKQWPATAQPMVDELAGQAEQAIADDNLKVLGQLAASAGVIAATALVMNDVGSKLARQAAAAVVVIAAGNGIKLSTIGLPAGARVRKIADAMAELIASGYAAGAGRIALQLAGTSPNEVKAAVAEHLTDLGSATNGLVGDGVSQMLSAAQFAGRLAALEQYPASQWVAVEADDANRCKPCTKTNGHVYPTLRAALVDYPGSGQNKRCLGGIRCRGFVRPITT